MSEAFCSNDRSTRERWADTSSRARRTTSRDAESSSTTRVTTSSEEFTWFPLPLMFGDFSPKLVCSVWSMRPFLPETTDEWSETDVASATGSPKKRQILLFVTRAMSSTNPVLTSSERSAEWRRWSLSKPKRRATSDRANPSAFKISLIFSPFISVWVLGL